MQQLPIPDGLDTLAIDRTEEWTDYSDTAPDVKLHGDNLAYVIYTRLHRPKGVAVSHGPLRTSLPRASAMFLPADCELASFAFDGSSHEGDALR